MRLLELKQPNIIVVYGGGFQPFHEGHMSSYRQAKAAFPGSAVFVAASNVTTERPFQFKEKQFLAQQAGVKDPFVQVGTTSYVNDNGRKVTSTPLNPLEVLQHFNPDRDVLVIVRSERDPMKTTGTSYYQPWQGIESAEPFSKHAYIYVTKKHDFKICNKGVCSGSEVRKIYTDADNATKIKILQDLYPQSRQIEKIKKIFDARLGGIAEANPNQQFSLWHPETKSYKGGKNKIPTSDYAGDNDITKNYQKVDAFKHNDIIPSNNFNVSLGGNDDSIEKIEQKINRDQLAKLVKAAMGSLTQMEKEVLYYRFWNGLTLEDIAGKLKVTTERIRQVEAKAIRKLKNAAELKSINENLDPEQEAENLLEYLRKIRKRWAIVSKGEGKPLVYFKGEGKPSPEWVERQERRIKRHKKR